VSTDLVRGRGVQGDGHAGGDRRLTSRPADGRSRDGRDHSAQPTTRQHMAGVHARPPFRILGHHGELNTIAKLRQEAMMLECLPDDGSDSRKLNRTVDGARNRGGMLTGRGARP